MTEAEWLASTDPSRMLAHLLRWPTGDESGGRQYHPHRPSDRKLRLFACACCRINGVGDSQVEAFERGEPAGRISSEGDWVHLWASDNGALDKVGREVKAALLRDIIGNPFHKLPHWDNGEIWEDAPESVPGTRIWIVCRWLTPTVRGIANRIYEERRFDLMPVLADALEEAGCENEDVLNHCRGFDRCSRCGGKGGGCCGPVYPWAPIIGTHVRGCWVLDLILGKE